MEKIHLLIDSNFLCHRAFHSTGELSYQGVSSGVIYGFLRSILTLEELFGTSCQFVFCWDFGPPIRKKNLSSYKSTREKKNALMSPEEKVARQALAEQVEKLRGEYLFDLGYKNVICQNHYEADDLIASVAKSTKSDVIAVSADKDLYQILEGTRVTIYNPTSKMMMTEKKFREEYHDLAPSEWWKVKALAGCGSDDVPGIDGVGDATAAKYLMGKVNPSHKIHAKFDNAKHYLLKNELLTKLPYPGCRTFKLFDDRVDYPAWEKLVTKLGMQSLTRR